jgi:hypothetical protein
MCVEVHNRSTIALTASRSRLIPDTDEDDYMWAMNYIFYPRDFGGPPTRRCDWDEIREISRYHRCRYFMTEDESRLAVEVEPGARTAYFDTNGRLVSTQYEEGIIEDCPLGATDCYKYNMFGQYIEWSRLRHEPGGGRTEVGKVTYHYAGE